VIDIQEYSQIELEGIERFNDIVVEPDSNQILPESFVALDDGGNSYSRKYFKDKKLI